MSVKYTATNLAEVGKMFRTKAENAAALARKTKGLKNRDLLTEAYVWLSAAEIIEQTTLVACE